MKTKKNQTKIAGDTYILCTFPMMWGGSAYVLDSGNSPDKVCASIAEHLQTEDDRISFCRVGYWTWDNDQGEMTPHDLTTIFEVTPYDVDALDDEDADECTCWGDNAVGHTDSDCPQHKG